MPRKPRFFLPDVPTHVVQRGNNRDPIFFDESDYHSYLEWLAAGAINYGLIKGSDPNGAKLRVFIKRYQRFKHVYTGVQNKIIYAKNP